jgi:hypothetical protein
MNSEIVSGKSCRMKALVWICTPAGILRYRETDLDVFYKRLKSSGMLCRVDCYVVTDVSAKRGSSIFKIKQSRKINHFSSLETWIFNAALRTSNHEFHFVSHHYTSLLSLKHILKANGFTVYKIRTVLTFTDWYCCRKCSNTAACLRNLPIFRVEKFQKGNYYFTWIAWLWIIRNHSPPKRRYLFVLTSRHWVTSQKTWIFKMKSSQNVVLWNLIRNFIEPSSVVWEMVPHGRQV